jgi:hypothetical protein
VQRVRGAASGAPAQRAQISLFWLWAMEYTVHAGQIGNVFSGLGCVQSGPLGRGFFDTGCTANCCGHSKLLRAQQYVQAQQNAAVCTGGPKV